MSTPTVEAGKSATPAVTQEATASAEGLGPLGMLSRRRQFVVNRKFQLRVGLVAASIALTLLILLNLGLFFASRERAETILGTSASAQTLLQSQDRMQLLLTLLGSAVFLVGVFLVSILETHKTAGAAFGIERTLSRLREGRWDARIRLRKGDHLQGIAQGLNELAAAVQDHEIRDLETLESIATRLETCGGSDVLCAELLADLRRVTTDRRRRLG